MRQGRARDFMEHMLNRGRTRAIGTRWNIHFSAWFCRSLGLSEFESFSFLWVLQLGMKSSCIPLSCSATPCLCLFAKLFFCRWFCKYFPGFLYSSLFRLFPSFSFLHRVWLNANLRQFSIYTILLREKIYIGWSNVTSQMCFYTLDYFLLCRLNSRKSMGVNDVFPSHFQMLEIDFKF